MKNRICHLVAGSLCGRVAIVAGSLSGRVAVVAGSLFDVQLPTCSVKRSVVVAFAIEAGSLRHTESCHTPAPRGLTAGSGHAHASFHAIEAGSLGAIVAGSLVYPSHM